MSVGYVGALSYAFLGDLLGEGVDAYAPQQTVALRDGDNMVELREWFRVLKSEHSVNTARSSEKRMVGNRIFILVNGFSGRWLPEPQLVVHIEVLRRQTNHPIWMMDTA